MCPKDDLEMEDLDNQAPERLVYEKYLVGFLHHTCSTLPPKKDKDSVDVPRYSKLKNGVKPLFHGDELEDKMTKGLTRSLFPKGS